MRFWELDINILSQSTQVWLEEEKEEKRLAEDLRLKCDRYEFAQKSSLCPGFSKLCKPVWMFLENPRSSVPAMVYSWVMYVVLPLVSVACIGTLSPFVPPQLKDYSVETDIDVSESIPEEGDNSDGSIKVRLIIGLVICTAFTVEMLVRFVVWPSKIRYLIDPSTWSDVVGVLVATPVIFFSFGSSSVLRSLIILQLFRIFRLWRSYESCQILSLTLLYSAKQLCLTLVISLLIVVNCAYLWMMFELHSEYAQRVSIKEAFWFSFVTLTNVGYGDLYPLTPGGKFIAVVCGFGGICNFLLLIPILVHHYNKACRIISINKCLRRLPIAGPSLLQPGSSGESSSNV